MPDSEDAQSDPQRLQWYRRRWEELEDILSTDDAGSVVARVRELQLDALQDRAAALAESDLANQEEARRLLQRVHDELDALRTENRALQAIRDRLGADSASDAVDAVDRLLARADDLQSQQERFEEAGFQDPDQALAIIESMEEQLSQLYDEKESTLEAEKRAEEMSRQGDTFEQLQALLAREERLQRELGVSSSEEVIDMVNGLVDQLEELYADRESDAMPSSNGASTDGADDGPFDRLQRLLEREEKLQEELGVSDPDEVVTMVEGLTSQLDDLYSTRERLAQVNLDDADSVIDMVNSMQSQLEVLYENQERMSRQGIYGVDHALSMIESMEEQLSQLYEERQAQGDGPPDERLQRMQERLDTLRDEKEALLERRQALEEEKSSYEQKVSTIEQKLGTADPEAISELVHSMEQQLADLYREREGTAPEPAGEVGPIAPDAVLDRLADANPSTVSPADLDDLLDDLPGEANAGVLCLDEDGTVRTANAAALRWPSIDADAAQDLVGANFFFDLAPATNNSLFRGRFTRAVSDGETDVRFPYTYVSKNVPLTTLAVHLYRDGPDAPIWILFRPMDAG